MRFILSSVDEESGDKVTHEFNALHINTVFERFEDFLRGCGYVFDGHIEVINDVQEPEEITVDTPVQDYSYYQTGAGGGYYDPYPPGEGAMYSPGDIYLDTFNEGVEGASGLDSIVDELYNHTEDQDGDWPTQCKNIDTIAKGRE